MSATSNPLQIAPAQPIFVASVEPLRALSAMADPMRWRILQLVAVHQPMCVTAIAAALGKRPEMVGKHLRILRAAGLVVGEPGTDQRFVNYSIPALYRKAGGLVDYGFCVLRIPGAA